MNKKKMIEEALGRIMQVREMIESFGAIKSYLTNHGRDNINCGSIYEELYRRELDEWRGLLMWGLIVDHDTRDRIKKAAYQRFLSQKMCVNKWMFNDGNPSSWLTATEEEFRKMVKEEFIEK